MTESRINLCFLLFPCIVTLSHLNLKTNSRTIQSPILLPGRTQLTNGTKLSAIDCLSFGPNYEVKGACFEEGSSGLTPTPFALDSPLVAILWPQKSRNWLTFVLNLTPFSVSCYLTFVRNSRAFTYDMTLITEKESVPKRFNFPDPTKTDPMVDFIFGCNFATFFKFRLQNQM